MDLVAWIDAEIAAVEAQLAAHPPLCSLDREGGAPTGLKEWEGRYAILRRARRLLQSRLDLSALEEDVRKAQDIAQASRQASPQWAGYARGVARAVEDIRRAQQSEGERASGAAPLDDR